MLRFLLLSFFLIGGFIECCVGWLVSEVVRENDKANNVTDTIFEKIGLQLHNRADHPLGILKNTIYSYFDTAYNNKFNKFDDLFPIVSVKAVSVFLQYLESIYMTAFFFFLF